MKKIFSWLVVGVIAISVISFLFGGGSSKKETPQTNTQVKQALTKEKFDLYGNIYSELIDLQSEYEDTYKKLGHVEVYDDVKDKDFPKYGSITRKITSTRDRIPKIKTSMSSDERDLSLQLSSYATALIFLSAKKDGIEGLDVANEEKETFKQLLNRVKDSNGF